MIPKNVNLLLPWLPKKLDFQGFKRKKLNNIKIISYLKNN